MQYVEFSNTGEIDVNAFKLLGASTKRGDSSKIGFFGTGLKYALAVLLREQVPVEIYIGKKKLDIGLHKTEFGGRNVNVVTINGEKTSLTTEAGIDWEMWFAIREIYSNALDEGGDMEIVEKFNPVAGQTKIYVGREQLGEVFDNWTSYFCQSRESLFENNTGRILAKEGEKFTVFRKGIRVYRKPSQSLFDYDIQNITINESRVAIHSYEAQQRSAEVLARCTSVSVIEQFRDCSTNMLEKQPDFWYYLFDLGSSEDAFSEAWYEAFKDKRIVPTELSGFYEVTRNSVCLPKKLVDRLAKQFRDRLDIAGTGSESYRLLPESEQDGTVFEEALALFSRIGLDYDVEKIFIGIFKEEDCGGVYDKEMDRIVIAEKYTKPSGKSGLVNVLFEEIAHAKSGQSDNTRGFQNYLIGIITSLAKEYERATA